ncbi:MAG: HAD family hydrolase [Thermoplasmata archaeon]|nr:HAD family hydrolase [Thermoplasmata archaeon]
MRKINAVTFDLWDTLIQEHPGSSDRVSRTRIDKIASALEDARRPHRIDEIEEAYRKIGTFLELTWAKARDMPVRDHVLFMLSCVECRLPSKLTADQFEDILQIYSDSILEHPPMLLPKARETLQKVHEEGYRIGLISNTGKTPGTTLRKLMDGWKILQYFEVTTFSNEIMVRKPAEAAFRVTLEQLKVLPKITVHIGDNAEHDVAAAKRLGMHAIHVVRGGGEPSKLADGFVSSLDEVVGIIDSL